MNFNSNNSDPFNQSKNASNLPFPKTDIEQITEEMVEREHPQVRDPRTVEIIRRSFIILTVIGLVIGVFVAAGVLYIMDKFNITADPARIEQLEQTEYK